MAKNKLEPEAIVDQLRALREQMEEFAPMMADRRKPLRDAMRMSDEVIQHLINMIGMSDMVAQAVGCSAEDARVLFDTSNRWTGVESTLRAFLNGVEGANILRKNQLRAIASRAYMIALQLAKDPAHATLLPSLEEVKRLKSYARRKPAAKEPEEP